MIFKNKILILFGLLILGTIICLDLLLGVGEPATFDGPIHITNISQFHQAISDGDFPVAWANNFSNYGSAIPIVAQQLPNYLGALLVFLVGNPVTAYKILMVIGVWFSGVFMFKFIRLYADEIASLTGACLYILSAYRIINLYIRGAGPELLTLVWIPLALIGFNAIISRHKSGFVLLTVGLTGLLLTHPLIFIAFQFLAIPYFVILWMKTKNPKAAMYVVISYILALLLGSYYLIPLIFEMKYFVISRKSTQLIPNQFLGIENYVVENWAYFGDKDIFVRKNAIFFGTPETILLLIGPPLLWMKRMNNKRNLIYWIILSAGLLILLTIPLSKNFYLLVPYMDSIQFPWRMLTPLSLIPPIILSLWINQIKNEKLKLLVACSAIFIVAALRIPQAYSKNSTAYPIDHYKITIKNPYFDEMNTLWTGSTHEYPIRTTQSAIIAGEGIISQSNIKNSTRTYEVNAVTPLRLVDYTFYFPGWNVYVDGDPTSIEFQDEKYRGVITYEVPQGKHTVRVVFEPTKVRLAGRILSLLGIVGFIAYVYMIMRKQLVNKKVNTQ